MVETKMAPKKPYPRPFSILGIAVITTSLLYLTYMYAYKDDQMFQRIIYIKDGKSDIVKTIVSFVKSKLSRSNSTEITASASNVTTAVIPEFTKSQTMNGTTLDNGHGLLDRLSEFENKNIQQNKSRFADSQKYIMQSGSVNISSSVKAERKRKVILEWTSFFGSRRYSANVGNNCPVICDVTTDRGNLLSSDAVVFHSRDMRRPDFPKSRLAHQRFVLFGIESPFHFGINAKDFNGIFNWTATYRHDADIRITYGNTNKLNTTLTEPNLRSHIHSILQNKNKLVMARISNCNARSNRLNYIRELQKYIPVDFYGACGNKRCPRSKHCDLDIPKQYKFILSFENSICRDYITEKFWQPLAYYNAVPVGMGGSSSNNYYDVAPPHSFLHVDQFKGPKQLADYLKILDKNDTLYEEFFLWHAHYHTTVELNFCKLCVALNNGSLPNQHYADLNGWFREDVCP